MLAYYSTHFSLVEVSTTFQGIPNPTRVRQWAESVPNDFIFNVLAFGGLTLHQRRPGTSSDNKKAGWADIAVEPPNVLFEEFKDSLGPLAEAGLLGLVILQFPPWFEAGNAGLDYISRCQSELAGLPLGIEFRNCTWLEPDDRLQATLELLIDLEIVTVTADFPGSGELAPKLAAHVTSGDIGSLRLHGRSATTWERVGPDGGYFADYSYSDADLTSLVPILQSLQDEVRETHVSFHVSPADGAVESCKRLLALLQAAEVEPDYTQWLPPIRK